MTIWTILTHAPLVVCSIIAISVILERVFFYVRYPGVSSRDVDMVEETRSPQDVINQLTALKAKGGVIGRAADALDRHRNDPRQLRDEATALQLQRSAVLFRKRLSAIATIAGLAPILGLLGTIVGLMRAFRNIGQSEGPVEPALIADGLWIALSTTAAGLVVAAVCLIAHALFTSLVRRRVNDAGYVMNQISMAMEFCQLQANRS